MHVRIRGSRGAFAVLAAALATVALSACGGGGSGSASASKLLEQTFSGKHAVKSGNLNLSLTISPTGSRTLTGPITLTFGGPFQSLGTGKLPRSDFNVTLSANGKSGSLGILSTGTAGYVTLQGTAYQLPASTFKQLESGFAGFGGGSGSGGLGKLGIDPLHWLVKPSVIGTESVGGTQTTHIRAGVNVVALLADINTFLQKAASTGVAGASQLQSGISATTRQKIANEVKNPSFDVWTGNSDKTLRKFAIALTLPVTGQASTLFGGLSSAQIGFTMQYANLNQPQTISAPTTVRPYSEFQTKLRSFLASVESLSGAQSSSSAGTASGSGAAAATNSYSKCIAAAGSDVSKMQACASKLK